MFLLLCLLCLQLLRSLAQHPQPVTQEELHHLKEDIHELRKYLADVSAAVSGHVDAVSATFDDLNQRVDHLASGWDTKHKDTSPPRATAAGGVTFTRWGRALCGLNGGDLIYSGQMGGPDSSFQGSATNLLCLPNDPGYGNYMATKERDSPGRGVMVVAEYKGNPNELFDFDNLSNGTTFLDGNIPCAVCLLSDQTSVLMIPAQRTCPPSWNFVYWGYLLSSVYDGYYQSSYECIEHAPDVARGGNGSTGKGTFLYHVEGVCGSSLPCPDYLDNRELTCVVCSR